MLIRFKIRRFWTSFRTITTFGSQPKLSGGKEPVIEFGPVGRNNASTFTGLCSGHDTELFKLIDTEPLDVGNAEQMNAAEVIRIGRRRVRAASIAAATGVSPCSSPWTIT